MMQMRKSKMNITILGGERKDKLPWYQDEVLNRMLGELGDYVGPLQCSFQNHTLVRSKTCEAIFDMDGRMIELYDITKGGEEKPENEELYKKMEFELVLLFSKINE